MDEKPKSRRGFASMTAERRTEIARRGGMSVAPEKRAFATNPALAVSAGRAGGKAHRRTTGTWTFGKAVRRKGGEGE